MKTKVSHLILASILPFFLAANLQAQPGFSEYVFEPNPGPNGITREEYDADPVAFRANHFPLLTIPVNRNDYFGIWNWFNHGAYPNPQIYDNSRGKRTYFFCRESGSQCGHNGVDWLVSYRNFGANEVINPFPAGAVVEVTNTNDSLPDTGSTGQPGGGSATLGNTLTLTCYLDGDADNNDFVNRLIVTFAHLKQNSIVVRKGQFVNPGQVLAQIGYSGSTDFRVTHIHATYDHMGRRLDPFDGYRNPNLSRSMFFDQRWVEKITNYHEFENDLHLTLNNQFYVRMPNERVNSYTFRASEPIAAIRVLDQSGREIPDLDVLELPNIINPRFETYWQEVGGHRFQVHEVSFRRHQEAHASVLNKEMPFVVEDEDGKRSNRVFVEVYQPD